MVIPRHEYLLTQGQCHKKNCPCQVTMQPGDPEAALNLLISCVVKELKTLECTGMTRRELELEEVAEWTRKN